MVTHLKHSEINKLKWDGCISAASKPLPYALSWYLDVVSPGWEALVLGDYKAVMPLPNRTKYGISYVFTPLFVQQLGVFGSEDTDVKQFIEAIPAKYKYIDINLNECNTIEGIANVNTLLSLNKSYEELYGQFADNARRNIKKAGKAGLLIKELSSPNKIIELFKANKGKDVKLADADYAVLPKLVKEAQKHNACKIFSVVDRDATIAGAIFISVMGRHIFLFSGNNEEARDKGAMHFLIAEFIKKHADSNTLLDFEGSNNANLARFYLSFGGYKTTYPKLKINRLPFPLNKLKA